MTETIKAIPTRYAGCHFRSRLEARWAVFFDQLGIQWEYEPEGFDLPSGPYLPDFLLALDVEMWFEVKGQKSGGDARWCELVTASGRELIIATGMPRPGEDVVWGGPGFDGWMESLWPGTNYLDDDKPYAAWDNGRAFCICPSCEVVGIQYEGRSGRLEHRPKAQCPKDDGPSTARHPRIIAAYAAARSARFEHGASGAT